ncbi:8-demethyl-8-(2,3-dimethoxy-alpha-L-rhamnosyl)-tetracenomycin-C 4'-O-methyltransferase [Lachnospiraceae bacterium]|nr:8-demethyl-8-(2,3-dimethoxy-alpha-L-rhamnosyl)-tetracenomycin-C 4'-O-methyltransferase [Lachnospiraceae bacterium]
MYRILIWGTGKRAENYLLKNYFCNCEIIGFIDTYKKDDRFMQHKVFRPEDLPEIKDFFDYIVIVTQYFCEIIELCLQYGINNQKIVITDYVQEPLFIGYYEKLKFISKELYGRPLRNRLKMVKLNESDNFDSACLIGNGKYNNKIYFEDYFRYRTFEFVADEILNNDIPGEVAEFGVFRGDFARLINEKFSKRKLFLFDTFEGFDLKEADNELKLNRCDKDFITGHANTSIEHVMNHMSYPEKCFICQGLFPESITKEAFAAIYAFVSIDVDFEESTYQGLKFFYPRLSSGGVIFLHDYHSAYLTGVKEAVNRFETENETKLKKIPLADRAGTLVIVK